LRVLVANACSKAAEARVEDLSFAPTVCLRYSMSVDVRGTLVLSVWIVALTLLAVPVW